MAHDSPLRVTKFKSINGWTYVVSQGFCVLGYYRSWMAAKAALAERLIVGRPLADQESAAAEPAP